MSNSNAGTKKTNLAKLDEQDFNEISVFTAPLTSLNVLGKLLTRSLFQAGRFIVKNLVVIIVIAVLFASFMLLEGPHTEYRKELIDISIFAFYWLILGIASSIGLGTGLHTFVLYLGPHIA